MAAWPASAERSHHVPGQLSPLASAATTRPDQTRASSPSPVQSARPVRRSECRSKPDQAFPGEPAMPPFQMVADAFRVLNGHRILRNRFNQRDDINLLTASLPHSKRSAIRSVHAVGAFYLPRDDEHGSRIKPCADHARDRIRAARAGRYQDDAQIVRSLRIVFRGDDASLFVVVADKGQIAAAGESIVQVHGPTARDQENVLYALLGDKAHDIVSESHALLATRLCRLSGGPEQHVHDLPHGAVPAAEFSHHLAMLSDGRARICRTGAETNNVKRG